MSQNMIPQEDIILVEKQGGFTYLFVLLALAIMSFTLLKSQENISLFHRQQQEAELLFRGEQIRQAIKKYQEASDTNGCYPINMEQLLVDPRGSNTHYHLRQWYRDPLTGSPQWGMVYDQSGRWIGVHSLGHGRPLRKEGFGSQANAEKFKKAKDYHEWVFAVEPRASAP